MPVAIQMLPELMFVLAEHPTKIALERQRLSQFTLVTVAIAAEKSFLSPMLFAIDMLLK